MTCGLDEIVTNIGQGLTFHVDDMVGAMFFSHRQLFVVSREHHNGCSRRKQLRVLHSVSPEPPCTEDGNDAVRTDDAGGSSVLVASKCSFRETFTLDLGSSQCARRGGLQVDVRQRQITEQDFRLIVDSIPDLVYTMTPACELEFVNQQVLDLFGKTPEELKDWDQIGVGHPDDLPIVYASLKRTVEFGEPHEVQQRLRRHDGVYRWFQPRARALRDLRTGLSAGRQLSRTSMT